MVEKNQQPLTLLLIEDNAGDVFLFEEYLEERFSKIKIHTCSSFADANLFLTNTKETFSLVFLDLNLPDGSGLELVSKVFLLCKEIPLVILSGHANKNLYKSYIDSGIKDFLMKDELNAETLEYCILRVIK